MTCMGKRSTKKAVGHANQVANVVAKATGDAKRSESPVLPPVKNPAAVELGRLGGLKGGKARAEKLTEEERSRIATLAAEARWSKHKAQGDGT